MVSVGRLDATDIDIITCGNALKEVVCAQTKARYGAITCINAISVGVHTLEAPPGRTRSLREGADARREMTSHIQLREALRMHPSWEHRSWGGMDRAAAPCRVGPSDHRSKNANPVRVSGAESLRQGAAAVVSVGRLTATDTHSMLRGLALDKGTFAQTMAHFRRYSCRTAKTRNTFALDAWIGDLAGDRTRSRQDRCGEGHAAIHHLFLDDALEAECHDQPHLASPRPPPPGWTSSRRHRDPSPAPAPAPPVDLQDRIQEVVQAKPRIPTRLAWRRVGTLRLRSWRLR